MTTLRIVDFVDGTTVDGPGFRTSIYFAGCDHRCPGCHNPSTWDFAAGRDMTIAEVMEHIDSIGFDVTFSGGDPLYQMEAVTELAAEIRRRGYTVWCYTGFLYEQLASNPKFHELARHLEVLVDGPFVEAQRDTRLLFRGSSNQRLIDMPATIAGGSVKLWESTF